WTRRWPATSSSSRPAAWWRSSWRWDRRWCRTSATASSIRDCGSVEGGANLAITVDSLPKPTPFYIRFFKAVALLRESWVGMIGAALIGFWVVLALLCDLLLAAGLLFPPNAGFAGYANALPGTPLILAEGSRVRISDTVERSAE